MLNWEDVLKNFQKTFGDDIYQSWIKNIVLKKEFNHYVLLSAPTRFVRDWIVSRYADKILDIIKEDLSTSLGLVGLDDIDQVSYSILSEDLFHKQRTTVDY